MKKLTIIAFLICYIIGFISATEINNITLNFSENDFSVSTDHNGNTEITYKHLTSYSEAPEPMLPWITISHVIPGNYDNLIPSYTYYKRLITSNVKITQGPLPVPTNNIESNYSQSTTAYLPNIYPHSNCIHKNTSQWSNITLVHFSVCPFIYDAIEGNLYFIYKIDVQINATKAENPNCYNKLNQTDISLMRETVNNPEILDKLPQSESITYNKKNIDYLIVTSNTLKDAFTPLINWKRIKGVWSEIITIEEIVSKYPGNDIPLKIKNYIYEAYCKNNLKYVLLGGDDTVVPVRGCYGKVESSNIYEDNTIPTDIYYSCFGGDFNWDANKNGIYGEKDDNIDLTTSIGVTRAPVRSKSTTKNFVDRTIQYEKDPQYNNTILLSGCKVSYTDTQTNKSDASIYGNILLEKYIRPYWKCVPYQLFDSYSDFQDESNSNFNVANLSTQINQGYSFLYINTHGNQSGWSMEEGRNYNHLDALVQTNTGHSIIVTDACLTNAFDISYNGGANDPSLSEALLRNSQSGIIGYIGSSRYGWSPTSYTSTPYYSQLVSALFFQNLFDPNSYSKNLANIVQNVKNKITQYQDDYNVYRWLIYSINPLGDPETQIFTSKPLGFNNINIRIDNRILNINTNINNCNICITSKSDVGKSFFETHNSISELSFQNYPDEGTVCITEFGYKPFFFT